MRCTAERTAIVTPRTLATGRTAITTSDNLITAPEDFTDSSWVKQTNVTITPNATTAPDGTQTADLYSITTIASRVLDFDISHLPNDVQYTFSIYAKAVTDTVFVGRLKTTGNIPLRSINIKANGWQRLQFQFTKVSAHTALGMYDFSGSTGDRFYVWGAQLETGSLGNYIPRLTAQPCS
jgi:hypothetical protein